VKVIFLDIDGVLNSNRSCVGLGGFPFPGKHKDRNWHLFDDVAVGLLRRVVKVTGAVCVLSSSWRLGMGPSELRDLAARLGVSIIDKTRDTYGSEPRGEQIQDWLNDHLEVDKYVILDDSSDMLEQQLPNFVRTLHADGLSYQNHLDAIRILEGGA
jgi:hypothetical protein